MSKRNKEIKMPQYETMYILRPDLGDELVDRAIERYQGLLREQGVQDLDTQHRGKRRLPTRSRNIEKASMCK
jgi:small subunit ribosomal protein S6